MNTYIQELLEQVKQINIAYEKEQENFRTFNIFQIQGMDHKEVPMCRFLGAILNPRGLHNQGADFLLDFAEKVLKLNLPKNDSYQVCLEEKIDDNRRIDLVVKGNGYWIPIEAKIYAGEQYRQCADYLHYAQEQQEDVNLYYLTPGGWSPSDYSTEGLSKEEREEKVCPIGWKNVSDWLKAFEEKNGKRLDEELFFCLKQYRQAIDSFVKYAIEENKMKKLFIPENGEEAKNILKAAATIYQQYPNIKTEILLSFLNLLKIKIEECRKSIDKENLLFPLIMPDDFDDRIKDYYKHARYPGVSYAFKKEKQGKNIREICGEEYEFCIRIEIGTHLYIGLCFPHTEGQGEAKYDNLGMPENWQVIYNKIEKTQKVFQFKKWQPKDNDWWLAWTPITFSDSSNKIEFKNDKIENEAYFRLGDKACREVLVNICCKQFEELYNYCKTVLLTE